MNSLSAALWAYRNKITNKLWGTAHLPAREKEKGMVLISYLTEPFTYAPWEKLSNFHTMYWEGREIARLFSERGYACDIVNGADNTFTPRKRYRVCIDANDNLERMAKHLPPECKKVFHVLSSHWEAQNRAEAVRLNGIAQRRGARLKPHRLLKPSRNAEIADFLEGFGNKAVFATYRQFNKPIFFVPISAVTRFDFPTAKDFEKATNHFLWLGGGGAVLKGLDLVLEAFSAMPDLHLHVCGPIYGEKDFTDEYKKELEQTPNIHVYGRIDVTGAQFAKLIDTCGAIIYPSGGEGTSGAVVQAMHAGLVPIITDRTGIQEDAGYIRIEGNPTPESVAHAARNFSNLPPETVRGLSQKIWAYARKRYTREEFSKAYAQFIDDVLQLPCIVRKTNV